MPDELTRIYQRLGRVEDKIDEILELLKPAAAPRGDWTCDSCRTSNPVERSNCVACGAMRPGLG